jgi:branched-chain amino acid transport system ATP-binding protein
MKILQVEKINTFYGLSHILFDVSLEINKGETVCLLGRNGVGKSTTLKSIIGLSRPRSGRIQFCGQEIGHVKTHRIAHLGIGYVPEDRIIFPDLTVYENLDMGIKRKGILREGGWTLDKIYEIFPVLKERRKQEGGTLSGGEQQMLTIARTLMGNPVLLLLDEPSEGLAPLVIKELYQQIGLLRDSGMAILLCEMKCDYGLAMSETAYILEKGHICWSGSNEMLKQQPEVIKEFLGV